MVHTERRESLTRDRVLEAAVDLADREGIDAVSMRRLGQELGVEAMSLYTHVRSKDDLLDGMAEVVVGRIPIAPRGPDWRATVRGQVLIAREIMLRHAWAPAIVESRATPGPAMLRYVEALVGVLLDGGFSIDLTHHTLHTLGSRILGFMQDLYDDRAEFDPAAAAAFAEQVGSIFPNIARIAMAASHDGGLGGCDDDFEFLFGLDIMLDGLERHRAASA